jgi:hypothetical protein
MYQTLSNLPSQPFFYLRIQRDVSSESLAKNAEATPLENEKCQEFCVHADWEEDKEKISAS